MPKQTPKKTQRVNTKETIPRHIKLLKILTKQKILKAAREKRHFMYKGRKVKLSHTSEV